MRTDDDAHVPGDLPAGAIPAEPQPVAAGPAVFSTAHLVWLDLESGDELSIEIIGPRHFLDDLVAQGFALLDESASRAAAPAGSACRIEARVGTN